MSATDRGSWSLNNPDFSGWNFTENVAYRANLIWNTSSLAWEKATGGAGAGNVTVTNFPTGQATEATLAKIPGLSIPIFDYCAQSQSATQDVWTFNTGGVGGTLVATVTINYVDATKAVITNVAKT